MRFLVRLFKAIFPIPDPPLRSQRQSGGTPSTFGEQSLRTSSDASLGTSTDSATNPPSPKGQLSGLDADQFQPLTQSEAFSATKEEGWQTAYWDSLNTIPPADLPRIQVIDRTMVGMGLISSEELAEIHQIGEEMDQYRTDYGAVWTAGQQAVAASRAQRERIKEEKKAEAAQKKLEREQEIKQRHENDIVFLGRGVSRGLADRRSNVESLERLGLPVLSTPKDLADAIGTSVSRLRWLAYHNPAASRTHYVNFSVQKRSGGERRLSSPHRKLAAVQRWILDQVLQKLKTHDAAHGFVRGRSTRSNAEKHIKSLMVVNADLVEFFPSIDFPRVAGMFRSVGYSPAVSTLFGLLCTESPRSEIRFGGQTLYCATGPRVLPQGACTSPAISNLVARRLDSRLDGLVRKLGWRYSRYADDLTFSTNSATDKIGYLMARLRHFVDEEGFAINEAKTRVQRRNARQSVTGIVVNDKATVNRKTVRRLRAILHRAKFEGLEAQNRDNHPNFRMWVEGMIAYVEMVNPSQAIKLRTAYREIR